MSLSLLQRIKEEGIDFLKAYGIKVKKYKDLTLLDYSEDSPKYIPEVEQCRGLVYDNTTFEIVARPYDRFYHHEVVISSTYKGTPVDFESLRLYEKLDGSLIIMYWYKGKWRFNTRGVIEALGTINNYVDITFSQEVKRIWSLLNYSYPPDNCKDYTFMFEIISPFNTNVVLYENKNRLVLHGVRHKHTGEYLDVNLFSSCGYEIIKLYPITFELLHKEMQTLNGREKEGYVGIDKYGNRVKFVGLDYLMKQYVLFSLHHTKVFSGIVYNLLSETNIEYKTNKELELLYKNILLYQTEDFIEQVIKPVREVLTFYLESTIRKAKNFLKEHSHYQRKELALAMRTKRIEKDIQFIVFLLLDTDEIRRIEAALLSHILNGNLVKYVELLAIKSIFNEFYIRKHQ